MKNELMGLIEAHSDELFDIALKIWEKPELAMQEHFASTLLADCLENLGFTVERGVFGLETAFRATWKQGEGGPNIGFLGEYDALPNLGHGCGHHLQTPACIGAAAALKEILSKTGHPCTLTVYGTPAEESGGGKIVMLEQGAFLELDAALATHASGKDTAGVGGHCKACQSYDVVFHGTSAHAASSPEKGRSAADAMLLSFSGVEFMREHVPAGTRMHYTVQRTTGPSNVVPDTAYATYTVRSDNNGDLKDLGRRLKEVIRGACIMTETSADVAPRLAYLARKPNLVLANLARPLMAQIGIPVEEEVLRRVGGSTDLGNVSCAVPTAMLSIPYVEANSHSPEWVAAGNTPAAQKCMLDSAKSMALLAWALITDPTHLAAAKEEFDAD